VKILLERGDVNPDSSDADGRTPLSYASGSDRRGVVKILIERGNANPALSERYGETQVSLAAGHGRKGAVGLLSEPTPFIHETPPNRDVIQISVPAMSAQEKIELGPVSQQDDTTPLTRHEITAVVSLTPSDKSLSNRFQEYSPASVPTPTPSTVPGPAILNLSRPLNRHRAILPPLHPSKRKHFPSS